MKENVRTAGSKSRWKGLISLPTSWKQQHNMKRDILINRDEVRPDDIFFLAYFLVCARGTKTIDVVLDEGSKQVVVGLSSDSV